MTPLKILHRGFDGLDISFNGFLPPEEIEKLEKARELAGKQMSDAAVKIGPGDFDMDIAETGARGGYKFRGDNGPLGATYFFKNRLTAEPGNIRVSVKSLPLALFGIEKVKKQIAADFERMGATIHGESVSRVDYAVDLLMPKLFELNPDQFVSHARARIHEINIPPAAQISAPGELSVSWSGRKATSVTVGKMPGRQIIVYDKRREVIAKQKPYWFQIWDIDPDDSAIAVWRVEIRFGKQYLSERANIRSYDDLDCLIQRELLSALDATRYLAMPRPSGNISRCPENSLWQAVRQQIAEGFTPLSRKTNAEEITELERRRIAAKRRKLIQGVLVGYLAAEGYSAEEAKLLAVDLMRDLATEAAQNSIWFQRKFAKAEERLRFT